MDIAGKNTLEAMARAKWYNKWLFSLMEEHLGGEILEVGAGIGNFTSLLAKKGNVTVIDIRKDYVRNLKNDFGSHVLAGLGDVEKDRYFFGVRKFDTVVCLNVLEHIKDEYKAMKNMFNLLKSEGKLVLLVPAHKALYSNFDQEIGHFRRYSKHQLKNKLEDMGLLVTENKYVNWWGAIGWLLWFRISRKQYMSKRAINIFDNYGKFLLFFESIVSSPFGLSVYVVAKKP